MPSESKPVEVRIHDSLFQSENPSSVEGGFLNDVKHDNEKIYSHTLVDLGFHRIVRASPWPKSALEQDKANPENIGFQGIRIAYFVSLQTIWIQRNHAACMSCILTLLLDH